MMMTMPFGQVTVSFRVGAVGWAQALRAKEATTKTA
jgi:hypothetical protein